MLGAQVYVLAPLAVKVAQLPWHIVAGGTVIVGFGFTVTVTTCVSVQPEALVPVMVYEVVTVGQAFTEAPVVALSAVLGVQVYEVAPEAVRVAQAF